MKKNLITAAILSCTAMTSFTALADGPNFYGRADLAITNSSEGIATQNQKDGTVLENNFSWLGVKGSEKISDDVEILYQMEFGVSNFDNSGNTFAARNSFLGIKTVAGTALVGRNDTVFKAAEGGFDLFGNTNSDIDLLFAGQNREADGVSYYSPKIADMLTLNATYLVDDNHDSQSSSMYALSATIGDKAFKTHNFYAAAAYQDGISDIEAYRAVVQGKIGNFIVGGLYQNSESQKAELAHLEGDSYSVNLAYLLGNVKIKAGYSYDDSGLGKYASRLVGADNLENMSDFEINQFSVGADYRVSPSTLVYGHYTKYDGDMVLNQTSQSLNDDIVTVGLRYDF
ncbi:MULTISPECIES: porin [unclassified Shewanella]|uniref:porin n=1 Tax=unclassified Shewanella TaxID=196818 RepID=UPI000C859D8F|nr:MULTISPECIES: porin [unclassified Shewanella]PMG32319.1 porin [Shewanella sp. 10N.286.52.C2]PMG45286.1 porin [Shewanella sp. 10N.286.52.B9]